MRRRRSVVWLCAWSVAVVVIGVHTGVAAYATHAQRSAGSAIHRAIIGPACSRWLAYSVPDYTTQTNANLQSIAAVPNSSQLWAVGWYGDPKSGNRQTLIEHYDGTHWSLVP